MKTLSKFFIFPLKKTQFACKISLILVFPRKPIVSAASNERPKNGKMEKAQSARTLP